MVANLFIRGVQHNVDMQYGAMLWPVIQDQIPKTSKATATAMPISVCKRSTPQNRVGLLSIHILRFLTDLVESPNELPLDYHRMPRKKPGST